MAENSHRNNRHLPAMFRDVGWILIGLVSLLWAFSSLGYNHLPYTHDGQIHLTRIMHYYVAIKENQFPPRWSGGLNYGFGYPIFNFNYPLPQQLALPFLILNLSAVSSVYFLTILLLGTGFVGMYFFMRLRLGGMAPLVGSLFYIFNPYVTNLIFVRGSLGELTMVGILPWLLYVITRLIWERNNKIIWVVLTALIASLYLTAHNVLVMITFPLIMIYSGYTMRRKWQSTAQGLILSGLIAGLLAAYFWIPALTEKWATILDSAQLTTGWQNHFLTVGQLLAGKSGFGISYAGPADSMNFSLGWAFIGVLLVAVPLTLKVRSRPMILLLLSLVTCLGLSLTFSQKLWEMIPIARYIQFPWRFLFGVTFIGSLISGYTYAYLPQAKLWWAIIICLLLFQSKASNNTNSWINPTNQDLQYATETTSTLDENMPRWFDKPRAYHLRETAFSDSLVITNTGQPAPAIVSLWNGTIHRYTITLSEATKLIERGAYYPGWTTTMDNNALDIEYQDPLFPGLITYEVPPGKHIIETQFTQKTGVRKLSNDLSLGGWMILITLIGVSGGKRLYKKVKIPQV